MLKFIFQLNNLFSRQKFKNHVADVSVFLLARLILRRNDDSGQQLLLKDETSDRVSPAAAVSILCCCFAVLCIATIQSNPVTLNFYTKQDVRYWGRWSFNSSVLFKDLAWISIIKKKKKKWKKRDINVKIVSEDHWEWFSEGTLSGRWQKQWSFTAFSGCRPRSSLQLAF